MTFILNPDNDRSRDNFIADLIAALPDAEFALRDLHDFINKKVEQCKALESKVGALEADVSSLEAELYDAQMEAED